MISGFLSEIEETTHLQPEHCSEVQMVGGLIQQQDRGLDVEGTREGDAHAPAAAELVGGAPLHGFAEAQAVQDLARARLGTVRSNFLQSIDTCHSVSFCK